MSETEIKDCRFRKIKQSQDCEETKRRDKEVGDKSHPSKLAHKQAALSQERAMWLEAQGRPCKSGQSTLQTG